MYVPQHNNMMVNNLQVPQHMNYIQPRYNNMVAQPALMNLGLFSDIADFFTGDKKTEKPQQYVNQAEQSGMNQTVPLSQAPASWQPFVTNSTVIVKSPDNTQMAVGGTLSAGNGQTLNINGAGLNGQGATQTNHFQTIDGTAGSTLNFRLLLI